MRIRVLLAVSAAFMAFVCGCSRTPESVVGKGIIKEDTVWRGRVIVTGDVMVDKGATLTVEPGTEIRFRRIDEKSPENLFGVDSPYYPAAELIIRGRLIARGKPGKEIIFTSDAVDARPADWGAVNFLGSDGSVVEYARFLCAYNGIHAHGSTLTVRHCQFVRNGVGISFKSEQEVKSAPWYGKRSRVVVTDCIIARNKGGIGFRNSDGEIRYNEIRDNKFFGLWPKEDCNAVIENNEITGNRKGVFLYQTRGVTFRNNNIYDNRSYNVACADAQDFPVDMRNNWFGTINRTKIAETIFDHDEDPDLARITFEPFLKKAAEYRR